MTLVVYVLSVCSTRIFHNLARRQLVVTQRQRHSLQMPQTGYLCRCFDNLYHRQSPCSFCHQRLWRAAMFVKTTIHSHFCKLVKSPQMPCSVLLEQWPCLFPSSRRCSCRLIRFRFKEQPPQWRKVFSQRRSWGASSFDVFVWLVVGSCSIRL